MFRNLVRLKVVVNMTDFRQYKFIVFTSRYLPWLAALLAKKHAKHFRVTD